MSVFVLISFDQSKAHLSNYHTLKSASWYISPVRRMDYFSKRELLTDIEFN